MKTWEKVILLIKSAGKYTKRKSKRGIALLAAVTMMLSVIPMTAFADTGMDHTTHTGCKALSMGTTYIMIDGVEQANNRLSDGNYYLTGDITATLSVNGNVSLCLNGFSVNADDSKGIKFYESGKSLTVDDCVGTGRISGDTDAIYVNYSNTTVTINGGAIGSDSCEYGIYTSDFNIKVFINGGSVTEATVVFTMMSLISRYICPVRLPYPAARRIFSAANCMRTTEHSRRFLTAVQRSRWQITIATIITTMISWFLM